MPKLGDEYQELVGAVQKVLDPGAAVTVGAWKIGPDGRRDMDVEVRGTRDGKAHFVLIECKDWKVPVGIGEIDALDSKRHDLHADATMIFSNSGFARPALSKAQRVGIQAAAAIKHGDERVRVKLQELYVNKVMRIDNVRIELACRNEELPLLPQDWGPRDLSFEGRSVFNWIAEQSRELPETCTDGSIVETFYRLKGEHVFSVTGVEIHVTGLLVPLSVREQWYSQVISLDASIGYYDHHLCRLVIPETERAHFTLDLRTFEKIESTLDGETPIYLGIVGRDAPIPISMNMVMPIDRIEGLESALLDEIVERRDVSVSYPGTA